MKKREFIKTSMLLGAGAFLSAPLISSCANANGKAKGTFAASLIPGGTEGFEQLELPYALDALEPYIDAQTMELHYGKHHAGYTKKFNAALSAEGIASTDINEIFANVSQYAAGVRNNGGGYYNHSLYWNFMSPDGGGEPQGALKKAIDNAFGSVEEFKTLFSTAAATQFGSGWAWLILAEDGSLQVDATANQDNPLMDDAKVKGTPLLNIDVWEHAYYLNYQNRRTEYISNFWNVVNWKAVEQLYNEAV
ncbi:MAG: superoxide dismutase [Bacteroidales bacterium]|jgi:Fe-Mn family superoxide dismutase|nr:superoxide dismutase [Bacteroidales bacterium]